MTLAEPKSTSRGRLWALTATHAGNDFYTGAVAALLPFFVLNAHYSYTEAAGITLAATALSSLAQPLFGYLSDRYGLRWLSLAGLVLAGTGVALSGVFADSYLAVWIVIAASGIGVAAYHPAATMEAREAGGGSSGSMSVFSVGGNVGVALAPSAVILVVGSIGLDGTAWLIVPALVLGLVHVAAAGRSLFAPAAARRPAAAPRPGGLPDNWRAFAWLTAVLATWSVAYVGTSTFVSLYAIEGFEATSAQAAVPLSVFPAAGALGTLLGGFLADRFGRLPIIRSGYLMAAAATAAMVFAPNLLVLAISTGVLGVSLFIPFAAQITLAHSYLPQRIGVASGVTLGLTLSLGGLVSPILGGLADRAGVETVFGVMGLILVVGFTLSSTLAERGSAPPPTGRPVATVPQAGRRP